MKVILDEVRNVDFKDNNYYLIYVKKRRCDRPQITLALYHDRYLEFEYIDQKIHDKEYIDIFDKNLLHVFSLENMVNNIELGNTK